MRRARSLSVLGIVLAGALGLLASTQTWLLVTPADGAAESIEVAGADAAALLAPLSLAALALGAALSIIGPVLRYVFGVLALAIAVTLGVITAQIITGPPLSAVAPAVTDVTGVSGNDSVSALILSISQTAWPSAAMFCWVVLLVAAVFTLTTARTWKSTGKRYRTDSAAHAATAGPLDAVDSWDDLSRGDDPTR